MGMTHTDTIPYPQITDCLFHLHGVYFFTANINHLLDSSRQIDIPIIRHIATVASSDKTIYKSTFIIIRIPIAHHCLIAMYTNFTINYPDLHVVCYRSADRILMSRVMQLQ